MPTKLETAYEAAIQQQAASRHRAITKFDREVARSILTAGLLAIHDSSANVAQYRVVAAPTGSGKSSYALAFIKAYIQTVSDASVLFLVETIQQAEATYREMSALLGAEAVAVWTSAHDRRVPAETTHRDHGFTPTRSFFVDDLASYPVAIVTHNFYAGRGRAKATIHKDGSRKLTFVDERPADVGIFDVDTGLIKTVRDRLAEMHSSNLEHVAKLTSLHDHLEAVWRSTSSRQAFDEIPATTDIDLSWFMSDQAGNYIVSSDESIRLAFSFGRALAKGFAFLSRYDDHGNGARFIGYEMNMPLRPGTILLDATADIDGVSIVVTNRKPVPVPQVDYSNLTITHIPPQLPKKKTLAQIISHSRDARPYAQWIMETVKQNTKPGEKILVVAHKGLFNHAYLPDGHSRFENALDLDGRQVCLSHWGTGIGSNRWREATVVFLFGDYHVPKRAMVGTSLGLREQRATSVTLAPFQSPNPRAGGLKALRDGNLCRHTKQLAMRGNARNIDENGVCGHQRLYLTCEFERLIAYKDQMFPGATITSRPSTAEGAFAGAKALASFFYGSDVSEVTTAELEQRTGVSLRKNVARYLKAPIVQKAMEDNGFRFQPGCGRGRPGRFTRTTPLKAAA
ncbi:MULTISPECIES: DEAD/DEAH box helicase family protein [unclassified Bradyrhizobium]|uniref:DEAD/DEAH box helicase family protein n=1 Tax=unclassified Bradyrhizobium TaxID=2631580 RepID=UPI0029163D2F|nr:MULTISPECIES: DEAD/DEAH box helicase family protein [unclassified Bradyrhizobium]